MIVFTKGSSHSDKELDPNTPEKTVRAPERKRKRKADDTGGGLAGGGVVKGGGGGRLPIPPPDKKISEYFKHSGSSPIRHGGAKSPSPQQPYPMVSPMVSSAASILVSSEVSVSCGASKGAFVAVTSIPAASGASLARDDGAFRLHHLFPAASSEVTSPMYG